MSTLLDADSINVLVDNPETPFGGVIVDLPDSPVVVELNSTTAPVKSVFGRIGDILALQADYAAFYAPLGGMIPHGGTIGQVLTKDSSTDLDASWQDATGGGGTPANPTASVGLTAVNGSLDTYMRSDGAPPINVAIAPTWSGIHTFSLSPIVPTPTTNFQAATKKYVDDNIGGEVPAARTLTIGGTAFDLSIDRSWTTDTILGLSGNGFVKRTAANTYTNDTNTYLTTNETITLTGDTTGSGTTAITTTTSNITGPGTLQTTLSATNTIASVFTSSLTSSGTAATGFGQKWNFTLEDSTTNNVTAANFALSWADATHATRTSKFALQLVNNAAAIADVLTISAAGNGVFTGTVLGSNLSGTNTGDQTTVTGSAGSLKSNATTGVMQVVGPTAATTRVKTIRDADDTILELGGSYTPTGTWTSLTMVTPVLGTPTSGNLANCTFPTLNQNTTGSAAKWTTGRTLALTGDVTYTSPSFDGSGNVTAAATLANIPAIAGTNLTGTAASLTAGNATKWTTGRTIALTGDVTYTSGSLDGSGNVTGTATLANIPTATTAAGSIVFADIAAPASPSAAHLTIFGDSTDLRFHDKNAAGTIGTTVVADTGASNNFLTAISAAGVISKAQPSDANLSVTDITTNNVTTSAHGFAPKGTAGTTQFWRQDWTLATPGGSGTVTATGGALTANSVVLGAGTTDTKVVAGIITDGTSILTLGVNTTTIGKVKMFGNTSGDATVQPAAVAGTATVVTLPNASSTLPIYPQQITYTGPTAARTVTYPDAAFTVARTDAANTFTGHQTIEGVTSTGATGTAKFVFDTSPSISNPTVTGATGATINRLKGTAGSYTVTMNGANTASVKTCVGSDIAGTITLTMSSTGNTSASICTMSGFGWASTPVLALVPLNANAWSAQNSTKIVILSSITTTGFDLLAGSVGLISGQSYTWQYVAVQ